MKLMWGIVALTAVFAWLDLIYVAVTTDNGMAQAFHATTTLGSVVAIYVLARALDARRDADVRTVAMRQNEGK